MLESGADLDFYTEEGLKCFASFVKAESCTQNLDLRPNSEKENGKNVGDYIENYEPEKMENLGENEVPGVVLVQRSNTTNDTPTTLEYKNLSDFRNYVEEEPHSTVGSYLRKNPMFLDFFEQSLNSSYLSKMKMNLPLNDDRTILLVKIKDNVITITGYNIYFISFDSYKVVEFDIPVTKYTLEQIKYLTPTIEKAKEPKIPLRLNPGVKKEDIKEAKQMVKSLRK